MSTLTITNTALLAAGIAGVYACIELAKSGNFIGAGIAGAVGLIAIVLYDQLPASNS